MSKYIIGFIEQLDLTDITLVGHDWGAVMGLHLAQLYPDRVNAIAFMEGHIHPIETWDDFDPELVDLFKLLRTESAGREQIVENNTFVEGIQDGIQRRLTEQEMDMYRLPFQEKHTRKPILRWVNQIPIEGHPADVRDIVVANQDYLRTSDIPKLLLYVKPGSVVRAEEVDWCTENARNLMSVNVGPGIHFLQEDHPDTIGKAIRDWLIKKSV